MELKFLGNTYTPHTEVQGKPKVKLTYQGKTYQARQVEAARQVAFNSISLTYRGVSYIKHIAA